MLGYSEECVGIDGLVTNKELTNYFSKVAKFLESYGYVAQELKNNEVFSYAKLLEIKEGEFRHNSFTYLDCVIIAYDTVRDNGEQILYGNSGGVRMLNSVDSLLGIDLSQYIRNISNVECVVPKIQLIKEYDFREQGYRRSC